MNHAVLYVRDAQRARDFYAGVLGFTVVTETPGGRAVFLRAPGSDNHHDLGLFSIGDNAGTATQGRSVGLYHIAWEVETIDELADLRDRLVDAGSLVGASDHGVSKSLYAKDVDGIEFEVMFTVPRELWGDAEHGAPVAPLDLEAEVRRFGTRDASRQPAPQTS
jgi:catechol-2,3-dioxygenase